MSDDLTRDLTRLFFSRIDSIERMIGLSRPDAAKLLTQIFERSSAPEVLSMLSREYGFAPAAKVEAEPEPEPLEKSAPEPMADLESIAKPAPVYAQIPDPSPAPMAKAEPSAEAIAAPASKPEPIPEPSPEPVSAPAASPKLAAPAVPAAAAPPEPVAEDWRAGRQQRQLEEVESAQDPEALLALYEGADTAVQQAISQRLVLLFEQKLALTASLTMLEELGHRIPYRIGRDRQLEMWRKLSARWEALLMTQIEQAESVEEMLLLKQSIASFWLLCDLRNAPLDAIERVYAGLVTRWLELISDQHELHNTELPPLVIDIDGELRNPIGDPVLLAAIEQAWEAWLNRRLEQATSMRQLKTLYESQDWDQYYRHARRLILAPWNDLTSEALKRDDSFAAIGELVRQGGSQLAINCWIETAATWDEVQEVCAVIDLAGRRNRAHNQLVEKILLFADTEDRIRLAHSLLRSHTLSWMMGPKTQES